MNSKLCLVAGSVFAITCSLGFGQELLTNPSFTDPLTTDCVQTFVDVTAWTWVGGDPNSDRRNGDFEVPTCPRDGDGVRASIQGWGSQQPYFYQVVSSGVTPGQPLRLSGQWWYSHLFLCCGNLTVSAELRAGSDPNGGTLIAQAQQVIQGTNTGAWVPFCICGTPPGSTVTVVIRAKNTDFIGYALHVDDLSLVHVGACGGSNSVTAITPTYGGRGAVINDAAITGTGFTAGSTTVKLAQTGQPDIVATDVQVLSSTSLTCDFNLAGVANGKWNVVVNHGAGGCPPETVLPGGFLVALPALSNGSFELPTAAGGCPATPISGHPTDWLVKALSSWGDAGYEATSGIRDDNHSPPTCPPPDGLHYASTYSIPPAPNAQPESHMYQTLLVDNTKTYTFSGYFAGAGNNTAVLELLDGDELASGLPGTAVIHDGGPAYDWTFAYVQGQPTGNLMTVRWRVTTRLAGPHVAHADKLRVDICTGAIGLTGISPALGDNTGTLTGVTLTGSGFSGGPTPQVLLTRAGQVGISGTAVTVVDDSHLTCNFDLTGRVTGLRDVVVFKDGCVASLEDGFVVAAPTFTNGDFELPDPGVPIVCPPTTRVSGVPSGWTTSFTDSIGRMDRDVEVFPPGTCPSPSGGHYGSMSIDRAATLKAFQVLRAQPNYRYTFDGRFAGGGSGNNVYVRVLDGAENGTVLQSTQVHDAGVTSPYDWSSFQVQASPTGGLITVVWEMEVAGSGSHATHSDGLSVVELPPLCYSPAPDADGDHDVDQADFAVFQKCYSGPDALPVDPEYCSCFDHNDDTHIDQLDYSGPGGFLGCARGAQVPADEACDD